MPEIGPLGDPTIVMDATIARLNIERFRRKLAEETNESKRQTLLRLLAEEEAKLAAAIEPPNRRR